MGAEVDVLEQVTGEMFCLLNADCVEATRGLATESVGFSVFSPPFSSLYSYSNSDRDMGNCRTYEEFATHFRFLIAELMRVTKRGRLCSVHCMNLPVLKSVAGYVGIDDFRGDIVREFRALGWIFHSEVCIWKDPVVAMQRTKSIRLLHKQMVKDSCMSGQAIPDYLVTFRKPGDNPEPVAGELDWFAGDRTCFHSESQAAYERASESYRIYQSLQTEKERWEHADCGGVSTKPRREDYLSHGRTHLSIDIWQRYASPVWTDINQTRTLQYMTAKDEKDIRHIAPLQLDVIERCVQLWSNPGDVVLSPFAGIGSEGYQAVKMERRFIGIELKGSYFKVAANNLRVAEQEVKATKLF